MFHWTKKGRPLKGFTKAWRQACLDAGVPGRIPHDFRRTAVLREWAEKLAAASQWDG